MEEADRTAERRPPERDYESAGFAIGKWLRLALGGSRGFVNLVLLAMIVVGVVGVAPAGLLPEGARLWYLMTLGAAVLVTGAVVSIARRSPAVLGATLYIAAIDIGVALRDVDDARWLWVVGGMAILGGAIFMSAVIRGVRSERELERLIATETTSIAFFVTMVTALTYALLEIYMDLPRLTMWVPWSIGMGTWATTTIILRKRLS